jgi:hypothetical protein
VTPETVPQTPRLSVVFATHDPWPVSKPQLEALRDQVLAVDGEIIVGDGHGNALPEGPDAPFGDVTRVVERGASTYRLRALASARARAEIVAITEDHCVVAPDWCESVLVAHRDYPDAAAIGGVVVNGSPELTSEAGFLIANGPFVPPVRAGRSRRISVQANISYKRQALPRDLLSDPFGLVEMFHNERLVAEGQMLVTDPRMVVTHFQALTIPRAMRLHFDNGRVIGAWRAAHRGTRERVIRALACPLLPPVLFARLVRTLREKGLLGGRELAALPLVPLVLLSHAAGELTGYLRGPGSSIGRM